VTLERRLVLGAMFAWLAVAIANLITDSILGYDESAFATIARGDELPDLLYRSRGVVATAKLGMLLGDQAWQVRLPFVIVCLALPLVVFALGRAAYDARAGAWAAAIVACGHQLLGRNAHVLGDIPAVVGVVAGMAIAVTELSREDGPRWRLVAAAPAFAFAFYMRYGTAPIIALAMVAAPIVWFRAVRARPLPIVVTGLVFGVLLMPHVLASLAETGSVLGILRSSSEIPRRAYIGEGLVTYVTSNPLMYYGILAPFAVAGLVALVVRPRRATIYLAGVGLAQIVTIGLMSHGQPRYVFLGITLLAIPGVALLARLFTPTRILLVALAIVYALSVSYVVRRNIAQHRRFDSVVAAGEAIRADAHGRPCIVISSSPFQVLWYSRCAAAYFFMELSPASFRPTHERYIVDTTVGALDPDVFVREHHVRIVRDVPTRDRRTRVWAFRGPAD
jgi:hypothetical protein